jgi:hypothetical protein
MVVARGGIIPCSFGYCRGGGKWLRKHTGCYWARGSGPTPTLLLRGKESCFPSLSRGGRGANSSACAAGDRVAALRLAHHDNEKRRFACSMTLRGSGGIKQRWIPPDRSHLPLERESTLCGWRSCSQAIASPRGGKLRLTPAMCPYLDKGKDQTFQNVNALLIASFK